MPDSVKCLRDARGPFHGGANFQGNFEFALRELLLYPSYKKFPVVFGSVFRILISLIVFCILKETSEYVERIKINQKRHSNENACISQAMQIFRYLSIASSSMNTTSRLM